MALTQIKTSGIADAAVTLAKQASGTDGNLITYDASGNPAVVATGSDGQVLTSQGAGNVPQFENLPASNNYTHPNHSGDVTSSGDGATTIADNAVTLAHMAHGTDGNLITYDANGAPAAVTTGTSGQVLTSNGAGAAPTFQAAAGGGKVLQVQQVTYNSETVTNGNTWTDIHSTNFKVDITPASTASHFIIHCHINGVTVLGDDINYAQFRLKGTGSGIDTEEWFGYNIGLTQSANHEWSRGMATASYTYVETAQLNATNAVSFRVQFRGSSNDLSDNVYCGYGGSGASECSIVVMEVSPN